VIVRMRMDLFLRLIMGVLMRMARAIGMDVLMRMRRCFATDFDFTFTTTTGYTHRISPRFNPLGTALVRCGLSFYQQIPSLRTQ